MIYWTLTVLIQITKTERPAKGFFLQPGNPIFALITELVATIYTPFIKGAVKWHRIQIKQGCQHEHEYYF